jgi:hypothetical protein
MVEAWLSTCFDVNPSKEFYKALMASKNDGLTMGSIFRVMKILRFMTSCNFSEAHVMKLLDWVAYDMNQRHTGEWSGITGDGRDVIVSRNCNHPMFEVRVGNALIYMVRNTSDDKMLAIDCLRDMTGMEFSFSSRPA